MQHQHIKSGAPAQQASIVSMFEPAAPTPVEVPSVAAGKSWEDYRREHPGSAHVPLAHKEPVAVAVVPNPKAPNSEPLASSVAIPFLKFLDLHGRHNIVAMAPDSDFKEGKTFEPGAWDEIASWVDARNGKLNLYFSANEPAAGSPDKKLSKENIVSLRCVYSDIDVQGGAAELEEQRAFLIAKAGRLNSGLVPPSVQLDTGGGIQGFWRSEKKLPAEEWTSAFEDQGRGVASELGGDKVQNIDRVMRLPGTINIPTPAKLARGRVTRVVEILHQNDVSYTLSAIAGRYTPQLAGATSSDLSEEIVATMNEVDLSVVQDAASYDRLPPSLRAKFDVARDLDRKLATLWETGAHGGNDKTASGSRMALAGRLKKLGSFDVNEFGQLLWVWDYALKHGDDAQAKLSEREIARTWVRSKPPLPKDEHTFFTRVEPDDVGAADEHPTPSVEKIAVSPAKGRQLKFLSLQQSAAQALRSGSKPLVKGLLDWGAASVSFGKSNVGKTFVVMDLAVSISKGEPWCGMSTTKTKVAYVAAEGGQSTHLRCRALEEKYGLAQSEAQDFFVLIETVDLKRADADLLPLISAILDIGDVGFVVIDTLSRALAGGDENSSVDMGHLITHVDKLRLATGAHVMLVHHSGKEVSKGARGHSLLQAAVDTEIEITHQHIEVTKQRNFGGGFSQSFVLDTVVLGKDDDSDPITSCVVRMVAKDEIAAGEATPAERAVLDALRQLSVASPQAEGFKPGAILAELSKTARQDGRPVTAETLRSQLRALQEKLLVSRAGRGIWRLKLIKDASTAFFGTEEEIEDENETEGETVGKR